MRRAVLAVCLLAAGCGSGAPLPPAAEPASSFPITHRPAGTVRQGGPVGFETGVKSTARLADGTTVTLDPKRRELRVGDDIAPAGLGPTEVVVGDDDRIYVTDTAGGSILLFRHEPELKIVRRAAVPGRPYAMAIDREKGKLWVTVTERNEVVQLTADGAPRIQRRFPTVQEPFAIGVDGRGRVSVLNPGGEMQTFDGYLD